MFDSLRTHRLFNEGPSDASDINPLPVGLSRVSCIGGYIGIAFVNHESREILSMFSLEPGKVHVVNVPNGVHVVVECESDVRWSVSYSNRFNKSDPTRIETTLLRPRTPQEEMQDYLNEVAARAAGDEVASNLRSGNYEVDMENDDYSEHLEDDLHAPLTVYQMEGIINEIQKDIEYENMLIKKEQQQMDIEEEVPSIPLKTGARAPKKSAPADSKASESEDPDPDA